MSMTSIAGIREALFVRLYWYLKKTTFLQNSISLLTVYTFKPNFVYSFQINCKILVTKLH